MARSLAESSLSARNPIHGSGVLHVNLREQAGVRLEIFSVSGRRVDVLHSGILAAGRHDITWNALNEGRNPLPTGLYFVRLDADGKHVTKKVVLVQ